MTTDNSICTVLGIKYPILQGGMAWVATAELAAAVSNAGGLGIIGAGHMPADALKVEVLRAKELTKKPFGVNVMLRSPHVKEIIQLLLEEKVAVITTGAGNPGEYIQAFKAIGTKVIPVVASVALAKRLAKSGVDALIAEGTESGGHVGELTTMCLLPQIVDAVSIPVIAAGGIADGRGMVAAFALGAQAVQIGTRFVVSEECTAHEEYKKAIIKAKDRSAIMTGLSTGHPVRILENQLSREFANMERNGASVEELDAFGEGKLKLAARDGEVKWGSVMAGQCSGMLTEIKPVAEIIDELMSCFTKTIAKLQTIKL